VANSRKEINIKSREYWFRYDDIGVVFEYWALIDNNNNNDSYTIFFLTRLETEGLGYKGPISAIFDSLEFDCIESAIEGLKRNQYLKVDEFHKMFLPDSPPPIFVKWPFANIYSKRGCWKL